MQARCKRGASRMRAKRELDGSCMTTTCKPDARWIRAACQQDESLLQNPKQWRNDACIVLCRTPGAVFLPTVFLQMAVCCQFHVFAKKLTAPGLEWGTRRVMKNSSCSQSLLCKIETLIWEERRFAKKRHPLAKQRVDLQRRILICNRNADSQGVATICKESSSAIR